MKRFLRIVLLRSLPLLLNARRHKRLVEILSTPQAVFLLKRHPRIAYKYVGGNYLAQCFSASERLDILIHHYSRCAALGAPGLLQDIANGGLTLWSETQEDHEFAIHLRFPYCVHHAGRTVDHEGDLSLVFEIDRLPTYLICFTLCPQRLVHDTQSEASCFFIGRVQGVAGRFETIRKATKLLRDVSPRDVLMAALQGLAQALGVQVIAGVGNREQLSMKKHHAQDAMDYDRLWAEMGAQPTPRGPYLLPLPLMAKPIESIPQRHRSRTLRKRRFKQEVSQMAEFVFNERYGKPRQEEVATPHAETLPAERSVMEIFA